MPSVQDLYEDNAGPLQLAWLAGEAGSHRALAREATAAADLVGHLNLIHPERIQVFGHQETEYFERLTRDRRLHQLSDLLVGSPPALIVAEGLKVPAEVLEFCRKENVPLFSSPLPAAHVIDYLRGYLTKRLSETTSVHGVLMDVLGMGVLITGESGLGKSELALELVSRGHGLVADDVVELSRVAPTIIEGRCPTLLQNMLEVRGLGLLDIKAIFGETAVRRRMRLKLMVHLVRRSTLEDEYERLPLDTLSETILGVPIRKVAVPVAAGRNIAVLLEAAVRNTILQLRGIDTMREFMDRQRRAMESGQIPPTEG